MVTLHERYREEFCDTTIFKIDVHDGSLVENRLRYIGRSRKCIECVQSQPKPVADASSKSSYPRRGKHSELTTLATVHRCNQF